MIQIIKDILNVNINEMVSTGRMLIPMLKAYSTLYLGGGKCRTCAKSHRKYYLQIKTNGLTMATKFEKAKSRTCIPKWNGLKYLSKTAKHWSSDMLTDEEATNLLVKGHIQEICFTKLPDEYLKIITPVIEPIIDTPVIIEDNVIIKNITETIDTPVIIEPIIENVEDKTVLLDTPVIDKKVKASRKKNIKNK